MKIDSERAREIRVTIVEGMQLLGSFDVRLREYAANKLQKQGVQLVKVIPRPLMNLLAQTDLCRSCAERTLARVQGFMPLDV